jgi:hypothetical protein
MLQQEQTGLGFPPLAIAAGLLPLVSSLASAFKKPKKEKTGPTRAELEAMARAEAAAKQAKMYRNIAIGVGVVAVLGIGGYLILKRKKAK